MRLLKSDDEIKKEVNKRGANSHARPDLIKHTISFTGRHAEWQIFTKLFKSDSLFACRSFWFFVFLGVQLWSLKSKKIVRQSAEKIL